MAETKERLGNGAVDGKRDVMFLNNADVECRVLIANAGATDTQLARIDSAHLKASMPPVNGAREDKPKVAHVWKPGDTTSFDGEVAETYLIGVAPNITGPGRVLGLVKAKIRVAHDNNGRTDECQKMCADVGFDSTELHDLDCSDELLEWAKKVAEESGEHGQTITHRTKKKQSTPAVKFGCKCFVDVEDARGNVKSKRLVGECHFTMFRDGWSKRTCPECHSKYEFVPRKGYTLKGTGATMELVRTAA